MDGSPGITLINGTDLNFNINVQHEDDEEDIEEENMRKEMLKAQLEHAFDDCWNESEHEDSGNSSSSDEEGRHHRHNHRSQPEKMFRKLSSISEKSPDETHISEGSLMSRRFVFSPPANASSKFLNMNGGSIPPMDGRGDGSPQPLKISKNLVTNGSNVLFKPLFPTIPLSEKSQKYVDENGEILRVAQSEPKENPYLPSSSNDLSEESCDKFQYNQSINALSEKPHESIDEISEAYRLAEYNSVEQLRVLYEVRMREIKELQADKIRASNHVQGMSRQLALMEAEKQRAVLSRTEASKLLVACKEEIAKLQTEVQSQKQTITSLEKDKAKKDETNEMLKVQIQELEQRLELMERFDSNKSATKHTEAVIKDLKAKHQLEVKLMQREMDSISKRLNKKEEECRELERRVTEQQRAQEQFLLEKSDTINQLARQLEESQAQCSQLMSANVTVENVRLQNQLTEALRDKEQLSKTVNSLQAECNMMRSDLTQYESLAKLEQPHYNSSSDETDSITQMGIGTRHSKVSNINTMDIAAKMRDELHRTLLNQKAKRAEIQRLEETIQEKDKQIKAMTEQERIYLSETERLKEQLNNMIMEKKTVNQKEFDKDPCDKSKPEEVFRLNAELAELKKEYALLEGEKLQIKKEFDEFKKQFEEEKKQEISYHNQEYLKFHDETLCKVRKQMEQEAEFKIKEFSVRLEQSLKEMNDVKEMYVSVSVAKEELTRQLEECRSQLQQVMSEREQLTAELAESRQLGDRLAKTLNEATSPSVIRGEGFDEKELLQNELQEYKQMRDHLARRVNTAERENAKLGAELDKLKIELENRLVAEENQTCPECVRLQEEMSAMSARHTNELTSARSELQAARDRLLQLEKSARQQFDTEIKNLRQDRDMLKAKCDEKEAQIKKLIESRKRTVTASCSMQTEAGPSDFGNNQGRLEGVEKRLREEYENNLAEMEKAHQNAVDAVKRKNKEDIERLYQQHEQMLEAELELKARHERALQEVEERTKQVTLEFCAAQIKQLEARYVEEASRRADPSTLMTLQTALQQRQAEIEKLKQMLAAIHERHQKELAALQHQMDADKDKAAQLMIQWSQELKNVQGELKLKEAIINDQRSQIQKARAKAKKLRDQLIASNEKMETEYASKCNQYKSEFIKIVQEQEKSVIGKVKQLEEAYQNQVKELKKDMKKKKHNM